GAPDWASRSSPAPYTTWEGSCGSTRRGREGRRSKCSSPQPPRDAPECGVRNAECGIERPRSIRDAEPQARRWFGLFRTPHSAFHTSRRGLVMTRVLVIDDEPGLRQALGLWLSDAGSDVAGERRGTRAR